jgi:hypothetical protein
MCKTRMEVNFLGTQTTIVVTYSQIFQTYAYFTFFWLLKKYLKIFDTKANFQAFIFL